MIGRLAAVLWVWALAVGPDYAKAAPPDIAVDHRGLTLAAMPLPDASRYDIELVNPSAGLQNLKNAIDRLYAGSKFSVAGIETLKRNGRVSIIYDAAFPKKALASVTIAAFFPDYFQPEGDLKEFLVVVGRFGIKWPTDKLAAILVHELVGHGLQHLRGRGKHDRKIDRECEAQIYEEAAYQDLDVKRDTPDMIRFRREMTRNWCADFRRYMRQRDPKLMDIWRHGRPHVPNLLKVFERYIAHQRETGIAGKAVAATAAKRKKHFDGLIKKAEAGSADDMFALANRYIKGIGTKKNLPEAAKWFRKSADLGHVKSQHVMGALYQAGAGVRKDSIEAYKWYSLASAKGFAASKKRLTALAKTLGPENVAKAEARAATWKKMP